MLYLCLFLCFFMLTGCFDSQPPLGVVGDIVGCIETENSIYCITEYPVAPISLATIVDDVDLNSIRFEQQIVTVTAPVTVFTDTQGIIFETENDRVSFFVSYATAVWKLETGKTYQATVFIDAIDRDRHEYLIWSYPVAKNLLDEPAVPVNTITDATLTNPTAYKYTALYVTGVVKSKDDDRLRFETNNDAVSFSVYSSGTPDLIAGFQQGREYTMPVFVSIVAEPEANQPRHLIISDYIKSY